MKYSITATSKFQKDLKRVQKRGYDIPLITKAIKLLANGEKLPPKYKDHQLTGDYKSCRECHITPDWLLVYQIHEDKLMLILTRTGTHSDLF